MNTKPTNTNTDTSKHCRAAHEFEASLTEAGVEACRWCPATRETPAEPQPGVDVPLGFTARRAA